MGLDFSIYWEDINNPINFDEINWKDFEKTYELCYGRKAWELVHALNLPVDLDEINPEVEEEDWVNLIESMKPIADKFDAIADAYKKEIHYEERGEVPRDITDLMVEYEVWYDKTFDVLGPTLGYEFSLGYMKEFYEANEKVMECFNDPNKVVRAIISY